MFGEGALQRICGHAEIEMALVELFRETGDRRYLDQARLFVERHGDGTIPRHEFGRAFWQDDIKVRNAEVLRGHAVRALYLACGAADVAVETGDTDLLGALETQWGNTVARRTYITGGMGSHHMDEAFGEDFVLPPDRSYCESCAGVASIMFSWRLLLATGSARYADLIERTLYNVVATSPAGDGQSFFYANTLHQRVEHTPPARNEDGVVIRGAASGRQPWFEVSCCPANVARALTSLGAYLATESDQGIQIYQYAAGTITTDRATLRIDTRYPTDGAVRISVERADSALELSMRIPAWAVGSTCAVNDGSAAQARAGGMTVVRGLREGDTVRLDLPMTPRFSRPDSRIDAVRGTIAVERGPEVFALESTDLPRGWSVDSVEVVVDDGIEELNGELYVNLQPLVRTERGWPYGSSTVTRDQARRVRLVRYHEWAERGPSTMRVWIPTSGQRG